MLYDEQAKGHMGNPESNIAAFQAAYERAPVELQVAVSEFWQDSDCYIAAAIAELESGFDAFAVADTTDSDHPCGSFLRTVGSIRVSAERSVGYFQINACNYPLWEWQRLYNARHNAGTAHLIWVAQGWKAWFFSAQKLGLV